MADFPALTPDERPYVLGEIPTAEHRGEGNVPILFRLGAVQVGAVLELLYTKRPTADIKSIWDHYLGQQQATFALPAAVWCGHPAAATIAPAGLVWQYLEQPQVEWGGHGFASTRVRLEAVGVNLGPTAVGPVLISGTYAGILGPAVPTGPGRPEPIPDPLPTPPVIVDTPPTENQLPPCRVGVGSMAELRIGLGGFFTTGNVEIGAAVTLTP